MREFFDACLNGNEDKVTSTLRDAPEAAAWVAEADGRRTGLMYAAEGGRLNIATALTLAGADVDAKNNRGSTPLMFAAQNGHETVVRHLLESQADPNIPNYEGITA